jgi:hypothetical protein
MQRIPGLRRCRGSFGFTGRRRQDGIMRPASALALWLLIGTACAGTASQRAAVPTQPAAPTLASPQPATQDVAAEVESLRAILAREVPQKGACTQADEQSWTTPAKAALRATGTIISRPQLVVVVDRNPSRQRLCVLLATPDDAWQVIGGSKVSTGQANRRGYFITPAGVFRHDGSVFDYRAEGTFNENGIRGLGVKGMRVWDFGWQAAAKGWTDDDATAEIRLLLHATDPDHLEQRLGRPASKGCVRIPAAMNRWLDHYGVLDAAYEITARGDALAAAVLAPGRQPTPLAGDMLIIVDSSVAG